MDGKLSLFSYILVLKAVVGILLDNAPIFSSGTKVGEITSHHVEEASGLAASRVHPGVLYVHNDKGDSSKVYAISTNDGSLLATLEIEPAANHDWEDIAIGICPSNGSMWCMFIGDIGDHGGDGSSNIIYVVAEPTTNPIRSTQLHPINKLYFQWNQADAETLMVDQEGNVILISKIPDGQSQIGRIPASAFLTNTLYHITNTAPIKMPHTSHPDPTGGDISITGEEVLVRTHDSIYYWSVPHRDYLTTMSSVYPTQIHAHHEKQPEAIAWDRRGLNFYTCSEGKDEPLYQYTRF